MRNSNYKKILILIVVSVLVFVCFQAISFHTPIFNNNNNRHMFIFNDSVFDNINKPSSSWVSKQDTLTSFVFSENLKEKKHIMN